jgi:hypothetical protein
MSVALLIQHNTIRGANSGALKKKLGLTVEATRTREVGPNKVGAKGSSTVYRITGSTRRTVPRPGPCSRRRASAQPTSTGLSPASSAPRAPRSAASLGSTRTACSGPAARAGARTCPMRTASPSSAPLGQNPRTARPRAPGQHRAILQGRMLPGDAQGGVAAVVPRLARFSRRCSRELVERAGAGHTRRVGGDRAWTQHAAGPTSSIAR